jgi:hypothetical protein
MKAIKWILIGALFSIVFAGCYTKLVHPPVTDESGTYYHPRKNCSDCHSSADYYYYHFPYYYDRWGGSRYWNSYYTSPWWYHDYWWWDGDEGEGLPGGPTKYWNERERPGTVPKLVPSAGGTATKDGQAPSVPGGSGSEVKEKPKTDNSGSEYYQPRTRPEKPKEEPKKDVDKEEKKAKEKQ